MQALSLISAAMAPDAVPDARSICVPPPLPIRLVSPTCPPKPWRRKLLSEGGWEEGRGLSCHSVLAAADLSRRSFPAKAEEGNPTRTSGAPYMNAASSATAGPATANLRMPIFSEGPFGGVEKLYILWRMLRVFCAAAGHWHA